MKKVKVKKIASGMLVTTMMITSQVGGVYALENMTTLDHQSQVQQIVTPLSNSLVTVNGGNLSSQGYESFAQAMQAIEDDEGQDYTIVLNEDVKLEANEGTNKVRLAHKNIVINGNGHKLTQPVTSRNYIYTYGDLTLENVQLDMKKTYLDVYGEGVTIEVKGNVSGTLELIRDESNDESSKTNQIIVHAPIKKSTIGSINGNGKNGTTQIILKGYGSKTKPAGKNDYPGVGSGSDGSKPAAFILDDSYIVAESAFNWGNLYLEGESGISITGTMQYATIPNYYVADNAKATLFVKKFVGGFGCLKVSGEVTGQTEIHVSGNTMPQVGDVLVQAPNGKDDSFVLVGVPGMELVRQDNGNYEVAKAKPIVSISSETLNESFTSIDEAIAAIQTAVEAGSTETYTIHLLKDVTLTENLVLPNTAIILNGNNHVLDATENVEKIDVTKSLVMRNMQLSLENSTLHYAPISGTKDRVIELENTVTGHVKEILDDSQKGYLDIKLYNTVQVDKVIGTSRTSGSRLTDLYLTNYGTEEQPFDISQMVENMAAVELNQSYISVSGDATNLGVMRTDSVNTTAGIVVSDDATINKLSIGENPKFKVIVEADKVLTIQEKSGLDNSYIPLQVNGTLTDGQLVIQYQGKEDSNMENMFDFHDENAKLYYEQSTKTYKISLPADIKINADQSIGDNSIYSQIALDIQDSQGIDDIIINGQQYDINSEKLLSISSLDEQWSFQNGQNVIEVYDVTGLKSTYSFILDQTLPTIIVQESVGQDNHYSQVSFEMKDNHGLDYIVVNGQQYDLEGATSFVLSSSQQQWNIKEGENVIEVYDLAKNHSTYQFIYDTTAPEVTYEINDQQVIIHAQEEITFNQDGWTQVDNYTWAKTLAQETQIDLVVTDLAGNQSNFHIDIPQNNVDQPTDDNQNPDDNNNTSDNQPIEKPSTEEPDYTNPNVEKPSVEVVPDNVDQNKNQQTQTNETQTNVQTGDSSLLSLYASLGLISLSSFIYLNRKSLRKH